MPEQSITTVALIGFFTLLLLLEQFAPLRRRKNPLLHRLARNLALTAVVFAVGSSLVRSAGLSTSEYISGAGFGLTALLPGGGWPHVLVGVLLMDLTFYYWHRANHEIPLLWRFHNVHHVDPDLDVSTSFRFHFVEIAYSSLFRIVQVAVIGVAPLTYVIYELAFTAETMFHHSNVRLPFRLERPLNRLIVTPRMHGIHHSAVRRETNSNYSVIFPWWDYLHRTLVLNVRQSAIDIGVPAYQDQQSNRLKKLLILPFLRQRQYWQSPDGRIPSGNQQARTKPTRLLE